MTAPRVTAMDVAVAVTGLAAAAVVGWLHWSTPPTPVTPIFLAGFVGVSAWLAAIDFREHRLPNRIVGPLAAAAAVWVAGAGVDSGDLGRAAWAFIIAAIALAVLWVMNVASRGDFGMGDVKYGTVAALTLGWFGGSAVSTAVMVMALSGGVVALVMLAKGRRHDSLAYGPYMILGMVAGLITAAL